MKFVPNSLVPRYIHRLERLQRDRASPGKEDERVINEAKQHVAQRVASIVNSYESRRMQRNCSYVSPAPLPQIHPPRMPRLPSRPQLAPRSRNSSCHHCSPSPRDLPLLEPIEGAIDQPSHVSYDTSAPTFCFKLHRYLFEPDLSHVREPRQRRDGALGSSKASPRVSMMPVSFYAFPAYAAGSFQQPTVRRIATYTDTLRVELSTPPSEARVEAAVDPKQLSTFEEIKALLHSREHCLPGPRRKWLTRRRRRRDATVRSSEAAQLMTSQLSYYDDMCGDELHCDVDYMGISGKATRLCPWTP
jgi:hypothetical protein